MDVIKYNNPDDNSRYQAGLALRIKSLGEEGIIDPIDDYSYVSINTDFVNDRLSKSVWQIAQNIEQFGEWMYQLDEVKQENLSIFYGNLSPSLELYQANDTYLLTYNNNNFELLYHYINSAMGDIYMDKLEVMYSAFKHNKWFQFIHGEQLMTSHRSHVQYTYSVDEPVIIICARPNYGHWVQDFFPLFLVANEVPELKEFRVFTKKLVGYEIEMLESINFDMDRIIQQDIPVNNGSGGFFRESYMFNRINPAFSAILVKDALGQEDSAESNDYVYLTRTGMSYYSRVSNEDEVFSALLKLGFSVHDPTQCSAQETVNKLRHAKVVVSTIGAHFSNLFFCQDAIIIAIYPDDLPRLSESVSQLSFDLSIVHSLPAFRNLILLKCKVDLSASVRNILDFPAIVEVDKLLEIVRHAKVIAG